MTNVVVLGQICSNAWGLNFNAALGHSGDFGNERHLVT